MPSPPSRARPMCNAMASRVAWSRSASRGRIHDQPDELGSRFAGSPGSRHHGVRDIGHSLELHTDERAGHGAEVIDDGGPETAAREVQHQLPTGGLDCDMPARSSRRESLRQHHTVWTALRRDDQALAVRLVGELVLEVEDGSKEERPVGPLDTELANG